MTSVRTIGVGLMGAGVVGSGVARILREKSEIYARQIGAPLELRRVLVPQGVAVFEVQTVKRHGHPVELHEALLEVALAQGWHAEAVYEALDGGGRRCKSPSSAARERVEYLVVLRRGWR